MHSNFIGNIWGSDLADMQLINKFNREICFSVRFDIFSEYAWDIPWKDKKGITVTNAFQKLLNESNCKLNKIWIDKNTTSISKNVYVDKLDDIVNKYNN